MKILFISPNYSGGIGAHAFRVAEKLREHGFEVKLMSIPHIPIKNIKNPSFAIFGIMKALFNKEKYDVVHGFNVPSAFVMKFIKAKKKVLSVHGVYSEQVNLIHSSATSQVVNIAEDKVLKWADMLTTDSKIVKKTYQEKLGLNIEYLPAPLDTTKINKTPQVEKIRNQVIYLGRDSFEKGIDILKKIEPKINGKVVYCTDFSWEEAMKKLKSSSIMVVPSRMESLPQTIKEAYFLKIPVIATNVGGIPEIVEHDVTGILVPPNEPEKLLFEINNLLEDEKRAERLAKAGYDFVVKNFGWDSLLSQYVKFYEKLISK